MASDTSERRPESVSAREADMRISTANSGGRPRTSASGSGQIVVPDNTPRGASSSSKRKNSFSKVGVRLKHLEQELGDGLEDGERFMSLTDEDRAEWDAKMALRVSEMEKYQMNHKQWCESFTRRRMFAYSRMRKLKENYEDRDVMYTDLVNSLKKLGQKRYSLPNMSRAPPLRDRQQSEKSKNRSEPHSPNRRHVNQDGKSAIKKDNGMQSQDGQPSKPPIPANKTRTPETISESGISTDVGMSRSIDLASNKQATIPHKGKNSGGNVDNAKQDSVNDMKRNEMKSLSKYVTPVSEQLHLVAEKECPYNKNCEETLSGATQHVTSTNLPDKNSFDDEDKRSDDSGFSSEVTSKKPEAKAISAENSIKEDGASAPLHQGDKHLRSNLKL